MTSTEANYSVTRRSNGGTLFTVRGNTAEEFANNLAAVGITDLFSEFGISGPSGGNVHDYANDPINAAVGNLQDAGLNPQTVSTNYQQPQAVQAQPVQQVQATPWSGGAPAQQAQPSGEQKHCVHGPMTYREGVSKRTGRDYKGWFCNMPQGQDCKPQYV